MSSGRSRRGLAAVGAAVVLATGGLGAVGWAATHQSHAPQPTAAAAGRVTDVVPSSPAPATGAVPGPAASPTRPSRTAVAAPATHGPVLPTARPVHIDIPSIGVHSALQDLGLAPDGSLQVPQPGPHYNEAAWFHGSPAPGTLGPAVIIGHVDSAADGPSVFFRLGALKPGDTVDVARADGTTAVFRVDAVRRYAKDTFPTATVYGNTDDAALRLITCGGSFDSSSGHYRDDVVVFAHLVGSHRR